jgi:exopolysaccharide production protein ExoZ
MTQQFTGVQILRLVAAMLVVVMHATQAVSVYITGQGRGNYWANGSAGVDIFFVISGFVMAMSTRTSFTTSAARLQAAWIFMKRRILRIAPLYWFYTLLKVALLLALPGLAVRSSLETGHLAASLLFIPSASPWGLIEPTLPVGWTLNFEMLFYAVFALAIAWGAPRIRFCLLVFLTVFVAGRAVPTSAPLAFYAQPIVFEFLLGVCIAHTLLHYRPVPPAAGLLAISAGLVLMFGIAWDVSANRFFTWGIAAAFVVLGTVWLEPWIARTRVAAPLSFLGDASYSIYLSHTFVVPAVVLALRQLDLQNSAIIVPLVCMVVLLAGGISYLWLERPMTSILKRALFKPLALSAQPLGK